MKINLKSIKKEDLEKLCLDKDYNMAAAQALFEYCFYTSDNPHSEQNLIDFLEIDLSDKEEKKVYQSRFKPAIKLVKDTFSDNYYRKNINPKPFKDKEYELTYLKIKPGQCLPVDDILIDENFVEVSQIGYFNDSFKYLAVNKDDVTWMSTDPNEINTMASCINRAKGNVMAFGLGLGYFPIMCASKKEVSKVLVVEKDPKIISIFKKHILPLCEFKDKIEVVCGDAFDYAKNNTFSEYNYLFIDIWHNPEDGLPMYLKLFRLLKGKKIVVDYWLEKSILAMYRRCFLTLIEEYMHGYKDSDYKKSKNEYDQIINDLYFKTKNMSFNSIEEIRSILKDNNLKKLI